MTDATEGRDPNEENTPFNFVDNRRFDPETGDVREGAGSADQAGSAPGGGVPGEENAVADDSIDHLDFKPASDEVATAQQRADELLADLQRERASFTNYRNRSLRDQQAARTRGIEDVLTALLPTLDDVARAQQHGELDGPFAAIADKLVAALGKFEVEVFGAEGEEFDPTLHEALMHQPDDEATAITITHVIAPGYKIGDKVVRAAQVAVSGPQQ